MTTALGIAGVTAVLRDLLNDGLINHDITAVLGTTVTVSVLPPDRVLNASGGNGEETQLNIFLYQVTPNLGWRNESLPSRDSAGRSRLSNPPLALDLHYLISAYSETDLHGDILLGYAAQLLHETPVLTREAIRTALDPSPTMSAALPPALRALADCGLADQIEQIKITPDYLNIEEFSKLWSATQSSMRPTVAYQVSVVLIEPTLPIRTPLPVLSRGPVNPVSGRDRGIAVDPSLLPPLPTIETIAPVNGHASFVLGETVTVYGHHLDGSNRTVTLHNDRFGIEETVNALPGNAANNVQFVIPASRAGDFPTGNYDITVGIVRPTETDARISNRLILQLSPNITSAMPIVATVDGFGTATFSIGFTPELRQGQEASIILGQDGYLPQPYTAPVSSLDFSIANAPIGSHLLRLRIDGYDSALIDRTTDVPVFLNRRVNI